MPLPPIITEVKNVRKTVRFRDGEDGSELCEVHVVESYKQYYGPQNIKEVKCSCSCIIV